MYKTLNVCLSNEMCYYFRNKLAEKIALIFYIQDKNKSNMMNITRSQQIDPAVCEMMERIFYLASLADGVRLKHL